MLGDPTGRGRVRDGLAQLGQERRERHGQHDDDDEQPVELVRQHLELLRQAEQHEGELAALRQEEARPNRLLPARAALAMSHTRAFARCR